MSIRKLLILGVLLAVMQPLQARAAGTNPPGWQKKIDTVLRHAVKQPNAAQRVIVRAAPGQEAYVKGLVKGKGKIKSEHRFISAFSAIVNTRDLEALASCPQVLSISTNAHVSRSQVDDTGATPAVADTLRATLGLEATSPTGAGVGVAIIDSGIAPSPEFEGRITAFYDFTQGGIATDPYDDYGHGTHVAGLVGGNGVLSAGQYQGVAPGARLIGLKALNAQGGGYASDIISALEFAIANKDALGIDVINMSLGHPVYESATTDPLVQAVNMAVRHGIVVVVSAGNVGINKATGLVGYAGITSPGNALGAITVGAANINGSVTRTDDTIADYSSRGPSLIDAYAKPDLVAPGHHMISAASLDSTLWTQYPQIHVTTSTGNELMRLNGTSMAAGVASGVVAVLIDSYRQAHPDTPLTPVQAKAILEFSAIKIVDAGVLAQGTGEINAAGALALAGSLDFSAAGTKIVAGVNESTAIGGEIQPWSAEIIWTRNIVHGDNIVWGEADGSGDNIVWGEADTEGDNIVWGESEGDNIVWGEADQDNIVWGESDLENIVWGECDLDNIVWGESDLDVDNIVWGEADLTGDGDNIVWGETILVDGGGR